MAELDRINRKYINIPFGTNSEDRIVRQIVFEIKHQYTPAIDFALRQRAISSALLPLGKPSFEVNEALQNIRDIYRFKYFDFGFKKAMSPVFSRPWRSYPIKITKAMKTLSSRSALRETKSRFSGGYVSKEMRRLNYYRYGIGIRGLQLPTNKLENMIIRDYSEKIFKNAITLGRAVRPAAFKLGQGPSKVISRSISSSKMYGIYQDYNEAYKRNLATWIAHQYVEKIRRYY